MDVAPTEAFKIGAVGNAFPLIETTRSLEISGDIERIAQLTKHGQRAQRYHSWDEYKFDFQLVVPRRHWWVLRGRDDLLNMRGERTVKYLLLQSKVIHTDDTSIKMLSPGAGKTITAKFWPYLGDWSHRYAVYDFTTTRERDGPREFLEGFSGYLQADAYSGYDCIYASDDVKEVACWVHARRYWHQAIDNDAKRANTALGYIARLSQIETQLRKTYPTVNLQGQRDFEAIATARQEHSVPILDEFKKWMDTECEDKRILPKSPIRKAFTYAINQWDALCCYTEEGYLQYDNNAAERLVKIPALGRKNYLFVGGERGGRDAAVMYSLVSTPSPMAWNRSRGSRIFSLGCLTTAKAKPFSKQLRACL